MVCTHSAYILSIFFSSFFFLYILGLVVCPSFYLSLRAAPQYIGMKLIAAIVLLSRMVRIARRIVANVKSRKKEQNKTVRQNLRRRGSEVHGICNSTTKFRKLRYKQFYLLETCIVWYHLGPLVAICRASSARPCPQLQKSTAGQFVTILTDQRFWMFGCIVCAEAPIVKLRFERLD